MPMNSYWFVIASLVLAMGCRSSRDSIPAEPARWVRVAIPESREQPETYPLSGIIVPQGGVQSLAFSVPGRVVAVRPREGESVKPGQILASLETDVYAAGLEAAAAQARAAEAAAVRAEDELRRMKILYDRQSLAENDFLKLTLAEQVAK